MGLGDCKVAFSLGGTCKNDKAAAPLDDARTAAALAPGRLAPAQFAERLVGTDPAAVLLLDLRSFLSYNQAHIRDAVNVTVHAPMLKKKGFSLAVVESSICKAADKERLRARKGLTVLLYEGSEELSLRSPILLNLYTCLAGEGAVASVAWLGGGYELFEKEFAHLCRICTPVVSKLFSKLTADPATMAVRSLNSHNNSGPDEPVQILNYLFLAGEKVANSRTMLHKYAIKHIVNSAVECECSFPGEFSYMRLDLHDSCSQVSLIDIFDHAFQFINNARDLNQNVLVHCRAGQSRSATIVVAYLMKTLNWDLNRAYSYVQRRRPAISPNLGFMGQLTQYDIQLQHARLARQPANARPTLHVLGGRLVAGRPAAPAAAASPASSTAAAPSSPWSLSKAATAPGILNMTTALLNRPPVILAHNRAQFKQTSPVQPASSQPAYFAMTVEDVPDAVVSASRTASTNEDSAAVLRNIMTTLLTPPPVKDNGGGEYFRAHPATSPHRSRTSSNSGANELLTPTLVN